MFKSKLSDIFSKKYSKQINVIYSNKKFSIYFNPTFQLGSFAAYGSARNYFAYWSGTDNVTGDGLTAINNFLAAPAPYVQTITDVNTDVPGMLAQLETSVVNDVGPFGSIQKILRFNFKYKALPMGDAIVPQSWFNLVRQSGVSTPPAPLNEYFYEVYFKLDPNLADRLVYPTSGSGGTNWYNFAEMKTGGYNGNNDGGDYRYVVSIAKDENGIFYRCSGDNVANGLGIVPGVDSYVTSGYWRQRTLSGIPLLGVWHKLEVYVKRPVNKDDLTTGITWIAITPMTTGIRQVIGHKVGGIQMGVQNLPVCRILTFGHYSGGAAPIVTDYANLVFYDGFPHSSVVRSINNIMYDY